MKLSKQEDSGKARCGGFYPALTGEYLADLNATMGGIRRIAEKMHETDYSSMAIAIEQLAKRGCDLLAHFDELGQSGVMQ